jgi:flagellar biosynthesis protein FlhA
VLGAVAFAARRLANTKQAQAAEVEAEAGTTAAAKEDSYAGLPVEPVEVHVGRNWVGYVHEADNRLAELVKLFRKQHALETGLVLPRVRFKDAPKLGADRYEIWVDGVPVAKGEARMTQWLAIHPTGTTQGLAGDVTKDPTYGLPAIWIDESQRNAASSAKFTLVDGSTVLMTHLTETLRRETATLLSRAETERLLARIREGQPGLVEELVPTVLSVGDVQKVLQNLLREKVSIRHLEAILETLADAGRLTKDAGLLTEYVRRRLGPAICQGLVGDAGSLQVLTLDPQVESRLLQGLQAAQANAQPYALEPRLAEQFMARMVQQAEQMMKNNLLPVLLCAPDLRRHIRGLCERAIPHLRVLALTEIPSSVELKSYSVVAL